MLDRRHHSVISSGETLLTQDFYARPTRRVAKVFLLFVVIVFLALFGDRLLLPWKSSASARTAARSTMRVWVNKKSGFYYCPDSKLYGKLKPGFFMAQDKALEAG